MPEEPTRDLRLYARSTQTRLVIGGVLLMILVGNGLIWLIFGPGAGRAAIICTGVALIPALVVAGWLGLLGWLAREARGE